MLAEAANRLNIKVAVLDAAGSPGYQVANNALHVEGSFKDPESIMKLAAVSSILTVEIEHVDTSALIKAREKFGIPVYPDPETIATIQDKYAQKVHFKKHDIPLPAFSDLSHASDEEDAIKQLGKTYGYPLMLKNKTLAYDGRGNKLIKNESNVAESIALLGGGRSKGGPDLYVEAFVPFEREVAVMVTRSVDGTVATYPCVDTIQKNNICHVVIAPAQIETSIAEKARRVAESAVLSLNGVGIFGVELFVLHNGRYKLFALD
ncbi:phosphoribosylaminoimidazole carboxylase ade2 [Phlyctochytrium bullatum]|nr:phosphoribosylaminoimidazole carboxylase ade2 [Phlyctochytrium bullatum]